MDKVLNLPDLCPKVAKNELKVYCVWVLTIKLFDIFEVVLSSRDFSVDCCKSINQLLKESLLICISLVSYELKLQFLWVFKVGAPGPPNFTFIIKDI